MKETLKRVDKYKQQGARLPRKEKQPWYLRANESKSGARV